MKGIVHMSKYQIDYVDTSTATKKIATELSKKLNSNLLSLSQLSDAGDADIHIIGFNMHKDSIPIDVLNYLEKLDGKQILFYVCDYLDDSEEHRNRIENKLLPFLPDECDYRGMFLCLEEMPQKALDQIGELQKSNIDDQRIQFLIDKYNAGRGKPDDVDIYKLFNFIIESTN
jgi:hypothetical protein